MKLDIKRIQDNLKQIKSTCNRTLFFVWNSLEGGYCALKMGIYSLLGVQPVPVLDHERDLELWEGLVSFMKTKRIEQGISIVKLASKSGMSLVELNSWELGIARDHNIVVALVIGILGYDAVNVINDIALGKVVSTVREKRGLTIEEMARLVGVDPRVLSRWEKGYETFDRRKLVTIMQELGLETKDTMLKAKSYFLAVN